MTSSPELFWKQQTIRELERYLSNLSGDLEQVRRPEYSKNTEDVARHLREVLRKIKEHVEASAVRQEGDIFRGWVRSVRLQFSDLNQLVSNLRASDLRQCPPILEWLAEQCISGSGLASPAGSVVILPNYELNHEYLDLWRQLDSVSNVFGALLESEESKEVFARARSGEMPITRAWVGGSAPEQLVAFSLGSLDRQTPLFYPMLGHEVGHMVELELKKSSQVSLVPGLESLADDFPSQQGARADVDAIPKRIFAFSWLRELVADLIGLRLFGPSYLFALACFLMTFGENSRLIHTDQEGSFYPSTRFRIRVLFDHLTSTLPLPPRIQGCLQALTGDLPPREDFFRATSHESYRQSPLSDEEKETLNRLLGGCVSRVAEKIPWRSLPSESALEQMVEAIRSGVPPLPPEIGLNDGPAKLDYAAQILTAGWVYYLGTHLGSPQESQRARGATSRELDAISVLLEKSLELICDFTPEESAQLPSVLPEDKHKPLTPHTSGVMSGGALKYYVELPHAQRLHIVPLNKSSFEAVSYDLHLGRWFKLARRTQMQQLAIQQKEERQRILREAYDLFHVHGEGPHGSFVLHPQDFALAVTKEYLLLPTDLMAFIDGKSGIGRTGLSIATAAQIAPGFRGCIVLELFNVGTVPLTLTPGMDIAQLVFQRFSPALSASDVYTGDFAGKIRP